MNAEFLARLAQTQTEEEKDWLLTELSLSVLSPELRSIAIAAAVPHWFDAGILAALQPDLASQAEMLYRELQALSFVEVFPERGYNIHERTRKAMLKHLWETDEEAFKQFSQRLVEYFGAENPNRIEQIYHGVVADFEAGSSQFEDYIRSLDHNFRRGEAEALLAAVQEQVEAKRVPETFAADVVYWNGRIHFRFYEANAALERYDTALTLYEQVGAKLGKANTLKAIGDVLQFLKRCEEALERYDTALRLYEQVGDNLGKANTLKAIGRMQQTLMQFEAALNNYQRALNLYQESGDRWSEAMTLQNLAILYNQIGRVREGYVTVYQANSILQDIEVPLSVMPYPNWLKRSIRFAKQGKWQRMLVVVVGVFAFPFALSFVAVMFLWRVTFGYLFATQPILRKWRYGLYALLSLAIALLVAWISMR
jgi:tetratricopeptide (TPR) repeat protein